MTSKLKTYGLALLIATALTCVAPAQENAAEQAREKQMDTAAAGNAYKEPHMAAALSHLRQAEEELEKPTTNTEDSANQLCNKRSKLSRVWRRASNGTTQMC